MEDQKVILRVASGCGTSRNLVILCSQIQDRQTVNLASMAGIIVLHTSHIASVPVLICTNTRYRTMINIDNTHILSLDAITSDINDEIKELGYTTLRDQKVYQLSLSCIALKEATHAIQRYLDIIDSDSDHVIE